MKKRDKETLWNGRKMNSSNIEVVLTDITTLRVDAIVNAANPSLSGGGGVDGAIHKEAGPQLLEECKRLGSCKTGEAKITKGYNLPASYVIHTVGPIYDAKNDKQKALLANCYLNSMKLAVKYKLKTIAFPAISTGVYGYPQSEACRIAIDSVIDFLSKYSYNIQVIFCCFTEYDYNIYTNMLEK